MKSHGILFSTPMVRALIDGRKTQTRRIVTWHNSTVDGVRSRKAFESLDWSMARTTILDAFIVMDNSGCMRLVTPIWKSGDTFWVREAIRKIRSRSGGYIYRADIPPDVVGHFVWLPSIHMPRAASRITLEIVSVRAQWLQDISESDAKREGVDAEFEMDAAAFVKGLALPPPTHRLGFKHVWGSIKWSENPPVWAMEFEVKK